jgi:hypothetical protein
MSESEILGFALGMIAVVLARGATVLLVWRR